MAYASAWKRRLFVVALGFGMIVLCYVWTYRISVRPYSPSPVDPDSLSLCYPPVFMGVLKEHALGTKAEGNEELAKRPGQAILFQDLREDSGCAEPGFQPVLLGESERYFDHHRPTVPEESIDFSARAVTAAYAKTDKDSFYVHNIADSLRMKCGYSDQLGTFTAVNVFCDGPLRPYFEKLTIYTVRDGRLHPYFASTRPIQRHYFLSEDSDVILVQYDDGVAGYRYDGKRLALDGSVKGDFKFAVARMSLEADKARRALSVAFVVLSVLILWVYRFVRTVWVLASRKPHRNHLALRICGSGCFALPVLLSVMMWMVYRATFLADYSLPVLLSLVGWVLIGVAAILPNRRIPGPEGDDGESSAVKSVGGGGDMGDGVAENLQVDPGAPNALDCWDLADR